MFRAGLFLLLSVGGFDILDVDDRDAIPGFIALIFSFDSEFRGIIERHYFGFVEKWCRYSAGSGSIWHFRK